VFTRLGATWTQQGSKLTGSSETGTGSFGYSVALSADGNTALIGGPRDNNWQGAAWVFAAPVTVPGQPTAVTATAGDGKASVSFAPPSSDGGAAITSYTVTVSPGGATAMGAASPIVVTGLTNGTSYTFTVAATNSVGTGPSSSPSPAVVPVRVGGRWGQAAPSAGPRTPPPAPPVARPRPPLPVH
jgi:hypothetical protein